MKDQKKAVYEAFYWFVVITANNTPIYLPDHTNRFKEKFIYINLLLILRIIKAKMWYTSRFIYFHVVYPGNYPVCYGIKVCNEIYRIRNSTLIKKNLEQYHNWATTLECTVACFPMNLKGFLFVMTKNLKANYLYVLKTLISFILYLAHMYTSSEHAEFRMSV